jgi:hypothetical protein
MDAVDTALEALMDFDTYAQTRPRLPHVLDLRIGRGRLRLLGLQHTHDPDDVSLAVLYRQVARFDPEMVWVEGGHPTPLETVRASIGAYGEAGLLVHLARRRRLPVRTLEPWRLDEARVHWPHVGREATKLFFVLRDLVTWHRGHRVVPIEAHAGVLLDNLSRGGVTGMPRRPSDLPAVCRDHLPALDDWRWCPAAWFDPALPDDRWTNETTRRSSAFRDATAVRRLHRATSHGLRVFSVLGYSHTVMQAPVWRRLDPGLREVGG